MSVKIEAPSGDRLRLRMIELLEKWKRISKEGDGPTDRLIGIDRCRADLEQALQAEREDIKEDRLYKTAETLLQYYERNGAQKFRLYFHSLDILDVCRRIIREGEGNPHPWV